MKKILIAENTDNKTKNTFFAKIAEKFKRNKTVTEVPCNPINNAYAWTVCVFDKEGNIITRKPMNATCERPFSIGRDKNCDLVLNSEYVGNVHLRIGRDDMGYFAKDSSLNGTFVNDKMYNNESFSLEEGLVYVADVPVYFKKNSDNRPNVIPKFVKDNVEETSKTKKFDGFNNTRSWKKDAGESGANRPFTR